MVTQVLLLSLLGYWADDHKDFNVQMIVEGRPFEFERSKAPVRSVDDYLKRVLYVSEGSQAYVLGVPFKSDPRGADTPADRPTDIRSLLGWFEFGGLWEDGFTNMDEAQYWGGLRAPNHFHDPLAAGSGGYTGIKTETGFTAYWRTEKSGKPVLDLFRPGNTVTEWVEGRGLTAAERNEWGYPTVSNGFIEYFTKLLPEERQRGLASAFRSMGQVIHLITDNTVPDHARDLAHPGNGFEEFLHARKNHLIFRKTPRPWPKFALENIERSGLRGFWDRDVYSGANPADALAEEAGICEYTQANFLAWNRFTPPVGIRVLAVLHSPLIPLAEGDVFYFTTVPASTGTGYGIMPYPRLTGPIGNYFGAEPPGLQFQRCIALKKGPRNIINEECWADYALPLMKRAHGTSETLFRLAMPPLRAELVPEPGDMTRFRVRLWNLGGASGDSVTLRLDNVSLSAVRFKGAALGTKAIEMPGGAELAPRGAPWTSQPFAFSLTEQGILKLSSYSAVVIEAHLGTNKQTPVKFAVPIPNGFPVVNQLTTTLRINAQTHATNTQGDCCQTTCTACGENAEYAQPVLQDLTGVIGRFSSHLDTLGREATGEVREAIDADTRIAGVALVSFPILRRYDNPMRPVASQLTVTSPTLVKRGDMYVRREDAADEADPDQIPFTISFDARDFFATMGGAATATQTVHLVVWMTSGAVYVQSLALWPMRSMETVDVALASDKVCQNLNSLRGLQYEMSGGCTSTRSGEPMCSTGTYFSTVRTVLFGPLRGLGSSDGEYFAPYPNLKLLKLGNVDVTTQSAQCPNLNFGSNGNYSLRCFTDLNSFIAESVATEGSGACPSIPPKPNVPRVATMRPEWKPEMKMMALELFGRNDEPAFQNVELR